MSYKYLTYKDRIKMERLLNHGISLIKIAELLECHLATVYRELGRGRTDGGYSAAKAQGVFEENIKRKGNRNVKKGHSIDTAD